VELNAFFLKYVLFIPPANPLNAGRLLLWFLLALPATREYYAYVCDGRVRRMGPNMWLALAVAGAEVLVIAKFARDTPFPATAHIPAAVVACWAIAGGALAVWVALKFSALSRVWTALAGSAPGFAAARHPLKPAVMNTLLLTAGGALAYLAYSQDVGWGLKDGHGGSGVGPGQEASGTGAVGAAAAAAAVAAGVQALGGGSRAAAGH
jgi:hypothetical protein